MSGASTTPQDDAGACPTCPNPDACGVNALCVFNESAQDVTIEVFKAGDGRVFANVNQGGKQLAHLKAGERYTITRPSVSSESTSLTERVGNCAGPLGTRLTNDQIMEWVGRHDLGMNVYAARAVIEDARSL